MKLNLFLLTIYEKRLVGEEMSVPNIWVKCCFSRASVWNGVGEKCAHIICICHSSVFWLTSARLLSPDPKAVILP